MRIALRRLRRLRDWRKIEDETTALKKELKAEWLGWSELPCSPLVQFKPEFYRLESSECNWPDAVGAFDPAEINYDVYPKVKPVILFTHVKSTILGAQPDSGPCN